MKLERSVAATVRKPRNEAEAAFSAGYKGNTDSSYARQFPEAFKAGKQAAKEARDRAEKRKKNAPGQ